MTRSISPVCLVVVSLPVSCCCPELLAVRQSMQEHHHAPYRLVVHTFREHLTGTERAMHSREYAMRLIVESQVLPVNMIFFILISNQPLCYTQQSLQSYSISIGSKDPMRLLAGTVAELAANDDNFSPWTTKTDTRP